MNDYLLSFLLGIIQGLTEFLPISSSAHLLIPSQVFGYKDLGLAFDIVVHVGTLAAVIFYFRYEIFSMLKSIFTKKKGFNNEKKLTINLVVATIPIIIFGLIFKDFIDQRLFNTSSIAIANILFALLLLYAFQSRKSALNIYKITILSAIFIGLVQCFALIPGASRSGTIITAALLIGLNIKDASKFAFLLAIPTIIGALILLIINLDLSTINTDLLSLSIGFFVSMFVAFLTIRLFLLFVEKIGMLPFIIYRMLLGVVLLII